MLFSEIYKTISSQEKKIVAFVIIFLIAITTLPFLVGHFSQNKGNTFVYTNSLAPGDKSVYYSYINQVKQGNYLFTDYFTNETDQPKMLNVLWLANGLFAKIFNLSAIFAFQFFRILLIPFAVIILYLLLSYLFAEKRQRLISFFLMCFASGIGILTFPLWQSIAQNNIEKHPIDLYVTEANLFLSMYASPHFIASTVLFYLSLILLFVAWQKNSLKLSVSAGICALLLLSFHPFHLFTVILIPGFYLFYKTFSEQKILWQKIKHYVLYLAVLSPSIIYYLYLLNTDLLLRQKALQNDCLTPPLICVILGFGFLFFLAMLGICLCQKNKLFKKDLFLYFLLWLILQFVLIYIPVNFQRRMLEGMQLPLVFFATIAIDKIYLKLKSLNLNFVYKILIFSLAILLLCTTNIGIIFKDIDYFRKNNNLFFVSDDIYQGINELKNHDRKIVFSNVISLQNIIPGLIGFPVYIGHGIETINFASKEINYKYFFSANCADEQRIKFLHDNNIGYLYFLKLSNNNNFNPGEKSYLKQIYSNDKIALYEVI